jgi:hypothetical protein
MKWKGTRELDNKSGIELDTSRMEEWFMTTRMKIYLAAGGGALVLFLIVFFVILTWASPTALKRVKETSDFPK